MPQKTQATLLVPIDPHDTSPLCHHRSGSAQSHRTHSVQSEQLRFTETMQFLWICGHYGLRNQIRQCRQYRWTFFVQELRHRTEEECDGPCPFLFRASVFFSGAGRFQVLVRGNARCSLASTCWNEMSAILRAGAGHMSMLWIFYRNSLHTWQNKRSLLPQFNSETSGVHWGTREQRPMSPRLHMASSTDLASWAAIKQLFPDSHSKWPKKEDIFLKNLWRLQNHSPTFLKTTKKPIELSLGTLFWGFFFWQEVVHSDDEGGFPERLAFPDQWVQKRPIFGGYFWCADWVVWQKFATELKRPTTHSKMVNFYKEMRSKMAWIT